MTNLEKYNGAFKISLSVADIMNFDSSGHGREILKNYGVIL